MENGTFLEKIITNIKLHLVELLEYYDNNNSPEICDDLVRAIELCYKLLDYDYFKETESYLNGKNITAIGKWFCGYNIRYLFNLSKKRRDLRKLFKIIVDNSEEWI